MWRKKAAPGSEGARGTSVPPVMAKVGCGQKPFRILVVDDSAVMREMLRDLLEGLEEWKVCGEAGDGREAIAKAQQLKPDLITLDLSMPVMNGLQTARELKRLMPKVPLVVITMFPTPHLEQEALDAGVTMVLAKSEPRVLISSLRAFVATRRSASAETPSRAKHAYPSEAE